MFSSGKISFKKLSTAFFILILSISCAESYNTHIQTVMIPTRDGTRLATDLYFPVSGKKEFPVILIRTPYNKKLLAEYGEFYSSNGYVTAIQDVRGKYDSEGEWIPYKYEGTDGYDAIEWLAGQEWSRGKVGMVGGSYSGSVQLAAAIAKPPHLTTLIPNITPASPFSGTPWENGAFALGWAVRWSDIVFQNISGKEISDKYQKVFRTNWYVELDTLPVSMLDEKISGQKIDFFQDWIKNSPENDSYYKEQDYLSYLGEIKIPVFLQSGWFDVANRGTKLIYRGLRDSGNENVKLVIGPWVHSDRSSKQLGPMNFGEEAGIDLFRLYLDWFDYWLKGDKNGIMDNPLVQIFNIGPNEWIYSDNYPPESFIEKRFYISGYKRDPESRINGELTADLPGDDINQSFFEYDPGNPTPGFSDFLKTNRVKEYKKLIENRSDVLVFESQSLQDPLIIAGPVSFHLFASSSSRDTDFSVNVTGVDTDGNIFPIGQTFGIIRAKHRNGSGKAEYLEEGKVYEFQIDLSHTFYTLKAGQKIRLEIASCMFPDFSRNLNTGSNNELSRDYNISRQTVFHNGIYPSHLAFYSRER